MSRLRLALLSAACALVVGIGLRSLAADLGAFGASDLHRFEVQSGIDLPEWLEDRPFFLTWTRGDGQVFMILAADPTAVGPADLIPNLSYRYTRIGFSLMARTIVGWNYALVPIGFVVLNSLGLAAIGAIGGWYFQDWGLRALLLPVLPAVMIGFVYDTAEVIATLAVLLSLVWARRAPLWGAVVGVFRPSYATGLLVSPRKLVGVGTAVLAAISLQVIIRFALDIPQSGASGTLDWPFAGYVGAWPQQSATARIVSILTVSVALFSIGYAWINRTWIEWSLAVGASALLTLTLSELVVDLPVNLLRASGMLTALWLVPMQYPKQLGTKSDLPYRSSTAKTWKPPVNDGGA